MIFVYSVCFTYKKLRVMCGFMRQIIQSQLSLRNLPQLKLVFVKLKLSLKE